MKKLADDFLVFDIGDEFVKTLSEFAERDGIEGASFVGIGGVREATIAYWRWGTKQYEERVVAEQAEVVSITGSISRAGDEFRVHPHVVLSLSDCSTVGGHLVRAIVRPTLELSIRRTTKLERRLDSITGLWLFNAKS